MLDFPSSPIVGQKYPVSPLANIPTYTWDGEKWATAGPAVGSLYVAKTGDTMAGHLVLPTTPAAANAVRKDYVDGAIAAIPAPPTTSTAEYLANSQPTKLLTSGTTWGSAQAVSVTDQTTVTINFSLGADFIWSLTAAGRTVGASAGGKPGQKGLIFVLPGALGTIIAWSANWKFPGGNKLLPGTPNGCDIVSYVVGGDSTTIYCSFAPDYK